ncbi:PhzF family phenazine biosynthesis protein [Auraticoccus monumenti]|uniref:Phenazine biosynthesis protein PhzF family n=1 Tax=Auraticoccus monumenti TaxID=675864 RepID=A0A1G7D902_9ACTN|nr:PhzF family phenazine biosynthesis protein [Auraticoccus monumenti]SDE47386.1 phenazine biosynthesis protein PhzF family [Auraticoccus monumenti]
MTRRRFTQLDVFGSAAGYGNPLAVVLDGEGLGTEEMQAFASWTNLSETTFLLPPTAPGADYRVRIFTTSRELPFAGHPTLGSAAAWLAAGGRPAGDVVVQECAAGLVPVRRDGSRLAFAAPPLTRHEPVDAALRDQLSRGLRVPAEDVLDAVWIVNGPHWIGVRLATAGQVLALDPDPVLLQGLDVGVVAPHPPGSAVDVEVRGFAAEVTLVEDPATGSLNAGLAQWLVGSGVLPSRYVAAQGTVLGRAGRISTSTEDGTTWVGGEVRAVVEGTVDLGV